MSLFSLLNGRNYGVYNRSVAKILGLKTTVFLSELLDKYEYFLSENSLVHLKDEEGLWFYITVDDMEERTTLGEKEQRSCVDQLVSIGFIRKTVAGQPGKRYFQVHEEKIHEFMICKIKSTRSSQKEELVPPKGQTRSSQREELDPAFGRISHIYKEPKEEPKEREGAPPLPPPAPTNVKNFVYKRVVIEMSKYNSLCDEFGVGKIKTYMDRLDEYADINPKKFKQYACHGSVIRNWLRRDEENNVSSKDWLQTLKERVQNHNEISVDANGVAFSRGQSYVFIKFSDHGSKQQITNQLRKMNISIEGLDGS